MTLGDFATPEDVERHRKVVLLASNWKNVAAQCAQALATLAQDERLDAETRHSAGRIYLTACIAHDLKIAENL